jgi:hypothetical protein
MLFFNPMKQDFWSSYISEIVKGAKNMLGGGGGDNTSPVSLEEHFHGKSGDIKRKKVIYVPANRRPILDFKSH